MLGIRMGCTIWSIFKHMIRNDGESLEVKQSLSESPNDQNKIEGTRKITKFTTWLVALAYRTTLRADFNKQKEH